MSDFNKAGGDTRIILGPEDGEEMAMRPWQPKNSRG